MCPRHGDLSKPGSGPRGREWTNRKWAELCLKLNSQGMGATKTVEKWKKAWSDIKNNTKKKWARIDRSSRQTGGGPALQISLTDLELRVLGIMGVQAATGMNVAEVGFGQTFEEEASEQMPNLILPNNPDDVLELEDDMTPQPGTSRQQSQVERPVERPHWTPPPSKRARTRTMDPAQAFLDADERARENETERMNVLLELEREKIRQRDIELNLQTYEKRKEQRKEQRKDDHKKKAIVPGCRTNQRE
ncbi:Uncharacterized protein OBRU01_26454 [Operophtera brumata]|uniref:Regulatory protein zeste n=1 Tax=Operophtera brumata TaxID=104452 RepID=A0A0L7K3T6_OPEBR|nr:Uncharacterized protein OBRU01_26454 [Operophtera brumata]